MSADISKTKFGQRLWKINVSFLYLTGHLLLRRLVLYGLQRKSIMPLNSIRHAIVSVRLLLTDVNSRSRSLPAIAIPSVVCLSSVCDVGAPYSGG